MAKYTASLTVALTTETAEAIYQAALEAGVGPSVMGRKLIEDGLVMRQLRRSDVDMFGMVSVEEVCRRLAELEKAGRLTLDEASGDERCSERRG